ncbi:hypothetical protein [Glaciibacter psychrotolerans]|uniref:Uncharacterized protein n=1 Tax=Glaciibacter psychrotolerans TaxID=670054 RepID=A0A7Z0EG01_9MICO|nr:hypothetical protein [Leifsonia psychrotolerans]NYJ20818.1 hypothetical protein [Leifsonia psychrotolerans]
MAPKHAYVTTPKTRPEWSTVSMHTALHDLAKRMFDTADNLSVHRSDRALLKFAAAQTISAASLVTCGHWDIDTARAWLDAGDAAVARVSA